MLSGYLFFFLPGYFDLVSKTKQLHLEQQSRIISAVPHILGSLMIWISRAEITPNHLDLWADKTTTKKVWL